MSPVRSVTYVSGRTNYADLVDARSHRLNLTLTPEQSEALKEPHSAVFYEWGPESKRYSSHLEVRSERITKQMEKIIDQAIEKQ
jgi:hypothetical protein